MSISEEERNAYMFEYITAPDLLGSRTRAVVMKMDDSEFSALTSQLFDKCKYFGTPERFKPIYEEMIRWRLNAGTFTKSKR